MGRVIIGEVRRPDTVPLAMLRILDQMPNARISLVEGTTDRLMVQLSQGELDLALVLRRSSMIRLEMEPLFLIRSIWSYGPRHPLLQVAINLARYLRDRWIIWPKGTPVRNALTVV